MSNSIQIINAQIATLDDKNQVSDGYHTFGELYEVRFLLFVALIQSGEYSSWKALRDADGSKWDGWFVAGINPKQGEQITFHLPSKYWKRLDIAEYDINPYFDGHDAKEVGKRLEALVK